MLLFHYDLFELLPVDVSVTVRVELVEGGLHPVQGVHAAHSLLKPGVCVAALQFRFYWLPCYELFASTFCLLLIAITCYYFLLLFCYNCYCLLKGSLKGSC